MHYGAVVKHLTTGLFTVFTVVSGLAQEPLNTRVDTVKTTVLRPDSNIKPAKNLLPGQLKPSPDALSSKVAYSARDSIRFDLQARKLFLYGGAQVKYDDIQLNAGYIEINWETNVVHAEGLTDSLGQPQERPRFVQAGQTFDTERMDYNFKSKKGRITGVFTKEGEGYLHGEQVKKNDRDEFFVKNGKYTTCNLPDHPHFYINATKIKVIPDDKIVTGPANLVIEDVPTPLAVPFGLFPNSTKRKSGILFPTYGESPALGFYLMDGGYYFGISEYIDAAITGTIYSRGSWGLKAGSAYARRYRFNGSFGIGYSRILQGDPELLGSTVNNDFFINWKHEQDPKAKPNSRFSASVQAGSSNYNLINSLNPSTIVTNTFQSGISFSQTFPRTPFSMVVGANHSQNTQTRIISVTAPEFQVNMNRIYPFKRKIQVGAPRQYEKIGLTYSVNSRNTISIADSLYGRPGWERNFNNGVQHQASLNTSFQVLNYITVTPSLNALSRWYFRNIEKVYDPFSGQIITDTVSRFSTPVEWNANVNASTRVFSFLQIGKNVIRHVMTPQVSFRYQPDFSSLITGNYGPGGTIGSYSPYEIGIYGMPSVGRQGTVGLGVNNNLEAKLKSKRDSSGLRKVTLIEAFNVNTGYNLAADSLNWQTLNVSARTLLFKKLDFVYSSTYDLYGTDQQGRRINTYVFEQSGKIVRLLNTRFSVNTVLASAKPQKKTSSRGTPEELESINRNPGDYVDFSIPWNISAGFNVNITRTPTEIINNQVLNINGDLNLTSKWKVAFSSGYDISRKELSFTTVDIYRDLHCWEMHFQWFPIGFRKSFNFTIRVKSSVLQDLKLNRRRQWFDLQQSL